MALRLHAHGIVFHVYFSWKTRPASTLLLFRNSSPKYIFHTSKKDLFFLRHTFSSLLKWEKVGGLWEMGSKIGFLSHAVPLPIAVVMMEKMSTPGHSPTKFSTPQSHLIWALFGSYLVLYLFFFECCHTFLFQIEIKIFTPIKILLHKKKNWSTISQKGKDFFENLI